jgi:protein dithiol oxidoreductase (disulfide-forming)
MNSSRRELTLGAVAAGLVGSLAPRRAAAQLALVEGTHYLRLASPAPTAAPPGKIEVVEFFWYECPHCNAFEPALDAWAKRLPDDVAFHRVPVWFREEPFGPQQRLFYTLEMLGLVPALHRKVFRLIHDDHVRLRTPEDISAFALTNDIDPVKFMTVYNSAAVRTKSQQARQIASGYGVDGVPAMGVQGRFLTNGTLANGGVAGGANERMLAVVDALLIQARQGPRG